MEKKGKKSKEYEPRSDEKDIFLWEIESQWDTPSFNLMSFVTYASSRSFPICSLLSSLLRLLICVFLQGIDYGIVMPSMWLFMQKLDPATTEVWERCEEFNLCFVLSFLFSVGFLFSLLIVSFLTALCWLPSPPPPPSSRHSQGTSLTLLISFIVCCLLSFLFGSSFFAHDDW
jgi:MFS family permease